MLNDLYDVRISKLPSLAFVISNFERGQGENSGSSNCTDCCLRGSCHSWVRSVARCSVRTHFTPSRVMMLRIPAEMLSLPVVSAPYPSPLPNVMVALSVSFGVSHTVAASYIPFNKSTSGILKNSITLQRAACDIVKNIFEINVNSVDSLPCLYASCVMTCCFCMLMFTH